MFRKVVGVGLLTAFSGYSYFRYTDFGKGFEKQESESFQLSDGRNLSFVQRGDLKGKPVFAFHGAGSSRFEPDAYGLTQSGVLEKYGVRLICVDRPGYGESSIHAGRSLTSFGKDILELADGLELNEFGVMGVSGGGCYALAAATVIPPERLKTVALVSSDGPRRSEDLPEILRVPQSRSEKFFLQVTPAIIFFLRITRYLAFQRPELFKDTAVSALQHSAADIKLLKRIDANDLLLCSQEGYRQGVRGLLEDLRLQGLYDWEFSLSDIRTHVSVFHGGQDPVVSFEWVAYFREKLPDVSVFPYPLLGHMSMVTDEFDTIVGDLVEHF